MVGFLVFLHIVVSILLMLIVIMQPGKGADLAGAFGGGGSQTAFGARGAATLLHKLTVALFIMFILTSIVLAVVLGRPGGSVMSDEPIAAETTAPVAPPATEALDEPVMPVEADEMATPVDDGAVELDAGDPAPEN